MGNGHGKFLCLTLSQTRERVGKGQNERDFRERVGKGRLKSADFLGKGSGKGQHLRSNFQNIVGKGGKGSFERDYAFFASSNGLIPAELSSASLYGFSNFRFKELREPFSMAMNFSSIRI